MVIPIVSGGGGGEGLDMLSERAAKMRDSLQKSQSITENMVSILGSFDHRLSALETAMRPTQIRTHAIRRAHENIDKTLKAAEVILAQFDLTRQAEAKILKGPHEDLESYLEAIEQLRGNIRFFSNNKSFKSSDGVLSHANSLLAKAILKLEDEFKQLLSSYSKPVEPDRLFEGLPSAMRPSSGSPGGQPDANGKNPSSNVHHHEHHQNNAENASYNPPSLIPPRILPLLHDLAQQMVEAGNEQQLVKIYRETRSSVLEESLRKLGVEKLSKDDVQKMQWEVLEAKIGNWIHFMRIAVKLLFNGERRVCDQMFEGFDSLKDQCFADVTAGSVAVLLSFGDAIAKSKRSPEKLFVLLDMYEIMRELHSEIETLFKGKACNEIRESALGLTKRLAQTAQETFSDFEEAVEQKIQVLVQRRKRMEALGRISWLSSSVLPPPIQSDNETCLSSYNLLRVPIKSSKLNKISCTMPESEIKENYTKNGSSGRSSSKMDEYNRAMKTMMRNPYEYHHDLGMNYTLITEELIVGSQPQTPEDIDHLKEEQNVAYILNLQQDSDVEYWGIDLPSIVKRCKELKIHHMRRPAKDFDPDSLRSILPKAVSSLDRAIEERKGRVYVHCTAGLGRAPATAIAYMFWFSDMDLNAAYDELTSKRPCGPNKRAIRGATYDLAKDDPWKEPFESLPDYAFENIADWERKLIQQRVLALRSA